VTIMPPSPVVICLLDRTIDAGPAEEPILRSPAACVDPSAEPFASSSIQHEFVRWRLFELYHPAGVPETSTPTLALSSAWSLLRPSRNPMFRDRSISTKTGLAPRQRRVGRCDEG